LTPARDDNDEQSVGRLSPASPVYGTRGAKAATLPAVIFLAAGTKLQACAARCNILAKTAKT
jgi:hypothetical protein